jgi:hypothetical protein
MPTPAGSPASPLRIDLARHVGVELGRSSTQYISLGETATRNLAGRTSGTIRLSDLWNKSNYSRFSIATDLFNVVFNPTYVYGPGLFTYQAGRAKVELFIASNSGIYSKDAALPALTISGWTTGDQIKITNRGTIVGRGGAGGRGDSPGSSGAQAGGAGGTALKVDYPIELDFSGGSILGGGGGGGGGGGWVRFNFWGFANQNDGSYGGGGGGGGAGSYSGPQGTFLGSGGAGGVAYAQELRTPGSAGSPGTVSVGGNGGAGGAGGFGGGGGQGGSIGAAGFTGGRNTGSGVAGADGGRAGYSFDGFSRVTIVSAGFYQGPAVN